MGFDFKSKKAKNKRNYSKARDYNTDKYDQSATQSKFTFTKLNMKKGPFKMKSPFKKAKGMDGKACWKGYRLAGTKKKGGKTVDNCVKA